VCGGIRVRIKCDIGVGCMGTSYVLRLVVAVDHWWHWCMVISGGGIRDGRCRGCSRFMALVGVEAMMGPPVAIPPPDGKGFTAAFHCRRVGVVCIRGLGRWVYLVGHSPFAVALPNREAFCAAAVVIRAVPLPNPG
jgi:hypothetical protein